MNPAFITARGKVPIREALPTDAIPFRELRLEASRDHPIAFTSDYHKNLNHPPQYWVDMLTMQPVGNPLL